MVAEIAAGTQLHRVPIPARGKSHGRTNLERAVSLRNRRREEVAVVVVIGLDIREHQEAADLGPDGRKGIEGEALERARAEDGIRLVRLEQQGIVSRRLAGEAPHIGSRAHVDGGNVLLPFDRRGRLGHVDRALLRRLCLGDGQGISILGHGRSPGRGLLFGQRRPIVGSFLVRGSCDRELPELVAGVQGAVLRGRLRGNRGHSQLAGELALSEGPLLGLGKIVVTEGGTQRRRRPARLRASARRLEDLCAGR